jgi:hypothetical protein
MCHVAHCRWALNHIDWVRFAGRTPLTLELFHPTPPRRMRIFPVAQTNSQVNRSKTVKT